MLVLMPVPAAHVDEISLFDCRGIRVALRAQRGACLV